MSDQPTGGAIPPKSFGQVVKDSFKELKETFVAFAKAPKALWGINIPYITEGLVYFGMITVLVVYCAENVGLNDLQSGWVTGAVTGGITFAMLLFGGLSDKIGVRLSLALSLLVMLIGRAIVSFSGTVSLGSGVISPMFLLLSFGLLLMVAGYGLYQPSAYAGVRRYTNPQTSAVGYAVIYGLMNLGAFFSGLLSPNIRHLTEKTLPPNGLAAVFWIYTLFTLISLVLTLILITKKSDAAAVERVAKETTQMNIQSGKKEEKKEPKKEEAKINNTLFFVWLLFTIGFLSLAISMKIKTVEFDKAGSSLWLNLSVIGFAVFALLSIYEFFRKRPEHPFRDIRFVFFIFVLVPVQTLFAHTWLTIPVYLKRAFEATSIASRYFETLSNLNPIIIFVLAPIIAGLTARANVYKMMIWGTLIMAVPTFLLGFGPNVYLFILYIVLMSIGEAMWQPRFLQWVAEIAPEGKTGMYMGIGQFPWFLTKMITASYSGYFISQYIPDPETGLPIRSGMLWLIYSFIALSSPVLLWLARGWMMKGMKQKA